MIENKESLKTIFYHIEDFEELTTAELSEIYWYLKSHIFLIITLIVFQ